MKTLFNLRNIKKINTDLKGKKILIADRGRIDSLVKNYCALKILSEKFKINPIILTHNSKMSQINLLYKRLGFTKFLKTFDLKNFFLKSVVFFFKSIFIFLKIIKFFFTQDFHNFIYKFKVSGINVGDIIYDRYIRDNHKYLNPRFTDISFLKYLFITIYKVLFLTDYLEKNKIKLLLVNTHSYTNNYSIIFKLAKKKKINLLYLKDFQISFFKNGQYSVERDPRILSRKKLKSINFTNTKKKIIKKYMKKRIMGKEEHFDTKNAFLNKKNSIKKFLEKNKIDTGRFKKKILIACHSFSDANHFYFEFDAKSPFFDYHSQIIKTLNFAKKNPDILFMIRPHPSSKFWKEEDIIKKILEKYSSKNIILTDNKFNTDDILNFVDTIITVHGTIGVEAAGYYKMKPILAGTGLYSNLGFSFDTKHEKDFFRYILLDKKKYQLGSKENILAQKALYYYFLVGRDNYKSFISRKKVLLTEKKYLTDLNNYLLKNKIESDGYYKILKKKLFNQKY